MGNTARKQKNGGRWSNTCFTSNASDAHASLNRLIVTTSSGNLAFRHARIALTASDRSVRKGGIEPSIHQDTTTNFEPADRQRMVTTPNAHAHGALTATFCADRNHGVKRVLVRVEIALLRTLCRKHITPHAHANKAAGKYGIARTFRILNAAIASGSASRSAQARNNLQRMQCNTSHHTTSALDIAQAAVRALRITD